MVACPRSPAQSRNCFQVQITVCLLLTILLQYNHIAILQIGKGREMAYIRSLQTPLSISSRNNPLCRLGIGSHKIFQHPTRAAAMSMSSPQNPEPSPNPNQTPSNSTPLAFPQQNTYIPSGTFTQPPPSPVFAQQPGSVAPWTNPRNKPSVYGKPEDPPVTTGDYQARILRANKEDKERLTWLEEFLRNPWRPGRLFYAWAIFSFTVLAIFVMNATQVYRKVMSNTLSSIARVEI